MQIIVLDTETSGLPRNYQLKASHTALRNWDDCRIVQLAYQVFTESGELIHTSSRIVKPDGFIIPASSIAIHKITNEHAAYGDSIIDVLSDLMSRLQQPTTIVAHNMQFDFNVIKAELIRADLSTEALDSTTRVCTMLKNTPKGGRWPKLVTLYKSIADDFDETKAHDALYDTMMCARVYFNH